MKPIKEIFITRHGEAEHNFRRIFAGSKVDSDLVKQGEETAGHIADSIKNFGGAELVVVSELKRSQQTGKILAKKLNAKVVSSALFNEINVGEFSGLNPEQVKKKFPSEAELFYSERIADWTFPDGESSEHLARRADDAWDFVIKLPAKKIAISSHGMFVKFLLNRIFGQKDLKQGHDQIYKVTLFDNGSHQFEDLSVNRKSILLIGWSFWPKIGGVETVMMQHARALSREGFKVSILTSIIDKEEQLQLDGITVFRSAIINPSEEVSDSKVADDLSNIIAKIRPNIVQFHNGCYPAGSTSMTDGARNVIKIFNFFKEHKILVCDWVHNAQLKDPEQTKILRDLPWDAIFFVSKFVLNSWKKLGYKSGKSAVFYNWVDISKFLNARKTKKLDDVKEKIIFFPSRILRISNQEYSKQKNFFLLAKACQILKAEGIDFKLVILADKKIKSHQNFKSILKEFDDINKNIVVLPNVVSEKMPGFYKAADITCIPSVGEAFSLSYLEAMAAGSVPIGTATGGTVEQIIDGENGFLVSATDPKELADVLERLISNEKYLNEIKASALQSVKKFDQALVSKELFAIYNSLLISSK